MSLPTKSLITGVARIFTLPRLSLPLITSLGLTLGAVLSVIAIVSALLFKPLVGIRDEQQLHTLLVSFEFNEQMQISYWDFTRLANFNHDFSDLGQWAGIDTERVNANINNIKLAVTQYTASDNILDVLGTKLVKGRALDVEDPSKLVWISNSLWQQQYSGLSSALESPINVSGKQYIIAGVIEDILSIDSQEPILTEQVWFIKNLNQELKKDETANLASILPHVVFRANQPESKMPDEQTIKQWQRDFIKKKAPSDAVQPFIDFIDNLEMIVESQSYRDNLLGDTSELIVILFIAVAGLLIMASLNLLNLFIAHYQGRTKEFGLQLSMGASLNKLRTLIFIENLPSMIIATITGMLTAGWIIRLLPMIAGNTLPMTDSISLDVNVLLSAVVIILILNVIFSGLCLIDINKHALMENLNSSGKGTQGQTNERISKALMVLQLAIASLLMTASVMLALKSYQLVYQDLGYNIENARQVSMRIDDDQWAEQLADYHNYYNSEVKKMEEDVAGILSQEISNSELIIASDGPLTWRMSFSVFNDPEISEQQIMFSFKRTAPGYFAQFGIPMIAGTNVTQEMINHEENVVVIDEIAARTFFPKSTLTEVINQELKLRDDANYRVIGIVPAIKSSAGHQTNKQYPVVYQINDGFRRMMSFMLRTPDDVEIDDFALQQKIQARFPRISEVKSETLHELWLTQTLRQRTSLYVVLAMTLLTMILAMIGVGGLTHMTTNHRKHELAIRMATGASQGRLLRLLFKSSSWFIIIGLGLGFILSVFSYEYMAQYMTALPNFNWYAMLTLDIVLLAVVSLAILWPAWNVIRRDPMQTLRDE